MYVCLGASNDLFVPWAGIRQLGRVCVCVCVCAYVCMFVCVFLGMSRDQPFYRQESSNLAVSVCVCA